MRIREILILFIILSPFSLEAEPRENSSEIYKQGAELARGGNINEAIPLFQKAVALSPYWALARYALGKSYLSAKIPDNLNLGLKELKMAADLDKNSADAWFYLGMAYYLKKDYPHAITSYYQAYTIDDTYIAALYNIGSVYDLMGHSAKAVLFYKRYLDAKAREEEYFKY